MYYNARSLIPKVGELHLECVMFAHSENVVLWIECSVSYCALVHYIMLCTDKRVATSTGGAHSRAV